MRELIQRLKMWLANRGAIMLVEPVDLEKRLYRVYCPKCRTWHTAYLSGLPGEEHIHLPCGEVVAYIPKHEHS